MTVQLKSSKTDIFRHRQSLTIACSSSTICAVMAMLDYFLLARPQTGPLLYFQLGRYLTRGVVSYLLQDSERFAGIPYQCLNGHSNDFPQACSHLFFCLSPANHYSCPIPARVVYCSACSAGEISEVVFVTQTALTNLPQGSVPLNNAILSRYLVC